jgi:hypothetical protein
MKGPAFPAGSYPGSFTYPCITSIDDNTGLIISGMSGTTVYTSVKSYNFSTGVWKNLTDTPFKRRSFACMRVTLSSGKDVVLVIGKLLLFRFFMYQNLSSKYIKTDDEKDRIFDILMYTETQLFSLKIF